MAGTKAAPQPPLDPGEFRFITNALTADGPKDGPRRFKAVASSTVTDLAGNTISLKALEQLRDDFRKGLTIFMDHDYTNVVDKVFGTSDMAEIVETDARDERTGARIWDLVIGGPVNEPNPKAVQLHDSIAGGYVKFGTSIGAIVRKHTRDKETGGMLIDSITGKEASIVGIPKNQRSWAYKASVAAADLPEDDALADDEPEEEAEQQVVASTGEVLQQWVVTPVNTVNTGSTQTILTIPSAGTAIAGPIIVSGDLSSKARSALSDSEFACPEKRLYPINDAAHVRAALSRVADPSNDQCGKDKIIAAARKMGIGEHATKNAIDMTDDELLTWALDNPTDDPEETPAEAAPVSPPEEDTTPGGQEADAATPETAPATEDGADPAIEQQADIPVEDVAALVAHAKRLVEEIGYLRTENERLNTELATVRAGYDRLSDVEKDATEAIRKVMQLPLRRRAVGHVEELVAQYPGLDPRVTAYIARATTTKENE